MYLAIAWRNVWRNPRRTLVILTAVVIGVWSMVFLSAFSRGMLSNMLKNGKSVLIGDIQIHNKDYRSDPSIEKSMDDPAKIETLLENILPKNAIFTKRIKVSAYISNARHSAGITLVGIDPEKEKKISFIGNKIVKGDYLKANDKRGILVGKALLDKFETEIGKKLIVMTRDKSGKVISKAFRIRGIYKAEMEATEKTFLFITMHGAGKLLNMPKAISEVSIALDNESKLDPIVNRLKEKFDKDLYSVESWKDLLPMLKAYADMFNSFMYIWYIVVFIAMGFGIVNTSLMAVFERVREFGLLRALGMKPWRVIKSVLTESVVVLLLGIIAGNFLGMISIFLLKGDGINLAMFGKGSEFFGMSRIIYPQLTLYDMMNISFIVFFLGVFVSLYPAWKAARITPVEAMRE
jgi:putative ABC transport system permease protein